MDRSLATLLRSLQTSRTHDEASRLLPAATGLLSRLSNPLNITLLSSQLLCSHLLYPTPTSLSTCRSIFSVFYTAALRFQESEGKEPQDWTSSNLSRTAWLRAIVQGADDRSPRWRHTLLLGGLLLGFEGQTAGNLPGDLRPKIEAAIVRATNLALQEKNRQQANSQTCLVFVLNTVFPLLSDFHRSQLDYDRLLSELIESTYFSADGLDHGYWLGTIDADVKQVSPGQFRWDTKSPTAVRLQEIKSRNLITSLGPLARLTAHTVENVRDPSLITTSLSRMAEFARNIALSWRQNKLSEVEASEEAEFLDAETLRTTYTSLLELIRNTLFAIVITLRAVVGRILTESYLSADNRAPTLATQCLHILRDTYFICHRFGQQSSSQYMFVTLTSIDILNAFPPQAETFLASIKTPDNGSIPLHPLDRLLDLYFLNISEHFTLTVSPTASEDLLMSSALPYITPNGDPRLNELYEAAHSVILSIFASPQNAQLSTRHIPFYIDTLLSSFPSALTARQFRLALHSIVQISSPHSAVGISIPTLQETILDLLAERAAGASEQPLPRTDAALSEMPLHSEKSTLVLAVIESLPELAVEVLEEWLTRTSQLLHGIRDQAQRAECQEGFWKMVSGGEMYVGRAERCVAWWSRGGREMVLFGELEDGSDQGFVMSGGLDSKL